MIHNYSETYAPEGATVVTVGVCKADTHGGEPYAAGIGSPASRMRQWRIGERPRTAYRQRR